MTSQVPGRAGVGIPGGVYRGLPLRDGAGVRRIASVVDSLERLPVPQRDALRTAFGMGSGPIQDRFLVGLAVLNLLSDAAEPQPLICVVDDEQWLDRASAQVLGFAARRLVAESIGTMNGFCLAAETLQRS